MVKMDRPSLWPRGAPGWGAVSFLYIISQLTMFSRFPQAVGSFPGRGPQLGCGSFSGPQDWTLKGQTRGCVKKQTCVCDVR